MGIISDSSWFELVEAHAKLNRAPHTRETANSGSVATKVI